MTHPRVGRSVLNDHALSFSMSAQCLCHAPREFSGRMILDCFLYTRDRLTLMSKVETIIANFHKLPEKKKLEVLMFGVHLDNPDYYQLNKSLQIEISQFLLEIKRFDIQ